MTSWQAIRDLVFRSLYKLGYKIGQMFVNAGKSLFLQAVESGIRMKVQEFMSSTEVQDMMENVLQQEMESAIQNIASELGIDSGNVNEPAEDEIADAIEELKVEDEI
tara:strand:- start:155 stop:475 length:321 start_codon:yes stop_codon:yes gene_type:complete